MSKKSKIGIVGCGNISGIYLTNMPRFPHVEIVAVADLDEARAKAQAEKFGVPRALGVQELLADEEVDIVLNLTVPAAHGDVALAALRGGKSVYNEKPLALRRREARELIGLAKEKDLRVGCAPDTFLGAGIQQCRRLIDSGAIGEPVAAVGFMLSAGVEGWHPNPHFFYQKGAGPLFDMGPYYLTALTVLLGAVRRVTASARISFDERLITSEPLRGQIIDVEVPTTISMVMDFVSGPVGTLITSFDVAGGHNLPRLEIYGSEGSLSVPDPNTFGGPVTIRKRGDSNWTEVPLEFGYSENSRGVGLADMAAAIQTGRRHRANDQLAYHVLDLMHSAHDSSESERHVEMKSEVVRPEPMKPGLEFGQLPD